MPNNHTNIKLRRGTAAEWASANELLLLGEPGFEKDTYKLKIGDGVTLWNDLPYVSGGMGGGGGPLKYIYGTDFTTTAGNTTVYSSDLTSIPAWLSTYEAETGFTQDGSLPGYAFGFDSNGLWFTGDAQPGEQSYPVRTNFDIPSESTTTVIFTVNHNDNCADQGICFYRDGDAPQWNWGNNSSRLAVQIDCPAPMIGGLNNTVGGEGNDILIEPGYYTFEVKYNPRASMISVKVYSGQDVNGTLLNTLVLNERLPSGNYRIGFVSDQDDEETKSYFSNLSITISNPISQIIINKISNNINFSEFFQDLIDNNQITSMTITSVNNSNNFTIFSASVPKAIGSNFVFDVIEQLNNLTLTNDSEYYINIDIIGSSSNNTLKICSIELVGNQYVAGEPVIVYQQDSTEEHKVYDYIDNQITLTRGTNSYDGGGGLYNSVLQEDYSDNGDNGPSGTEWNADGWDDLSDITTRTYNSLYNTLNGNIGQNITNSKLVMHDTINDKYYKFDFTYWQPGGGQGAGPNYPIGGFRYVRTPLWVSQEPYSFTRNPNDPNTVDNIDNGLTIKRNNGAGGIFNSEIENGWDVSKSPEGTLWNIEGWDDLSNVANREYVSFYAATDGPLGNMVTTRQYIMKDTINNKYYKVQFSNWGSSNGSLSYTREQINAYCQGVIKFGDGSIQNTAYNETAVSGVTTSLINDAFNTSLVAGNGISLDYDNNTLSINAVSTVVSVGSGLAGDINIDASLGDIFDLSLDNTIKITNPTNGVNGQTIRLRVYMETGDLTVTLDDKFNIPSSASSPLPWSTIGGKMDVLAATYHSIRDKWDVVAFVPGY